MYLFSKPLSQIDVKGKPVSLDTDIGTYFGIVLFNSQVECYMDTLIADGFTELRIDIPDYQNNEWLANQKQQL